MMRITDSKTFGAALRKRRNELKYTQVYLSEFTGFSVTFISDLERGKPTAELGKALHLASILGLDINMDVRGSKDKNK